MKEKQLQDLQTLRNILIVFQENNTVVKVEEISGTILFDLKTNDVLFRDALIAAGATFDIGYGCWTFWVNEE